MNERTQTGKSGGNIFAALGLAHPRRVKARAEIMLTIAKIIKKRGLTQKQVAEILNLPQSKVSCLVNGKLSMFSLDHLFELLNALDTDVKVVLGSKKEEHATIEIIPEQLEDINVAQWRRLSRRICFKSARITPHVDINNCLFGQYKSIRRLKLRNFHTTASIWLPFKS